MVGHQSEQFQHLLVIKVERNEKATGAKTLLQGR